jgi:hypothetical protein
LGFTEQKGELQELYTTMKNYINEIPTDKNQREIFKKTTYNIENLVNQLFVTIIFKNI